MESKRFAAANFISTTTKGLNCGSVPSGDAWREAELLIREAYNTEVIENQGKSAGTFVTGGPKWGAAVLQIPTLQRSRGWRTRYRVLNWAHEGARAVPGKIGGRKRRLITRSASVRRGMTLGGSQAAHKFFVAYEERLDVAAYPGSRINRAKKRVCRDDFVNKW